MRDLRLMGLQPRVVGTVRNIDRARDSANLTERGPQGVELLDFDVDLNEANVITSIAGSGPRRLDGVTHEVRKGYHLPVLDIDVPAHYLPSSTPGHGHLFIDRLLNWEQYKTLLQALAAAGIIEQGYAGASIARGHTAVRLPWVGKAAA